MPFIPERLITAVIGFISAIAVFMLFMKANEARAKELLKQDFIGVVAFAIGLVTIVGSLFLKGDLSVAGLAIGGFVAGFGALVALPSGISDALTAPRNIGLILMIAGIVVVFNYTIMPTWTYFVQAFHLIWDNTLASQAVVLVVGALIIVIGAAVFGSKERN